MRSSPEDDAQFIDIDTMAIIGEQSADIETALSLVSGKLKEADLMHRQKYGEKLIADIFHSSTSYLFDKVGQGIHLPSDGNRSFGLSMLGSIEKMYVDFEVALKERRELNDYTRYDLGEYKHAMSVLNQYLSGNPKELSETDAHVYLFYLRERHEHFVKVANEVDDEYKEA